MREYVQFLLYSNYVKVFKLTLKRTLYRIVRKILKADPRISQIETSLKTLDNTIIDYRVFFLFWLI